MSDAILPLKVVQAIEPRVRIGSERYYAIVKGPQEVSWRPTTASSFNDSAIQFAANPPSPTTIIDRKVLFGASFWVRGTGVAAAPATSVLQLGRVDASRSFPLSQVVNSMAFTINGSTISMNLASMLPSLLWYHSPLKTRREEYSMTPSMLDQSQTYAELIDYVRNPLGKYGDSDSGGDERRGAFMNPFPTSGTLTNLPTVGISNYTDVGGTFSFMLTVVEPVFLPPFLFGKGNESGFFGVQSLTAQMNLGNLTRVLSHAGQTALNVAPYDARCGRINTLSVSLTEAVANGGIQPTLFFNYLKPQDIPPLPKSGVYYPYFTLTDYPNTSSASVAPNAIATLTTNNVTLSSIPKMIYFFVRRSDASKSAFNTDTHAVITGLTVNWGTRSGLFSSASMQDLYRMSLDNGLGMSWIQFASKVGSVIAIDPAKDMGLNPTESDGLKGSYSIYATISFYNADPLNTITFVPYMVCSNEGTMLIGDNRAVTQEGVITKEDVLTSSTAPMVNYDDVNKASSRDGGDFFSSVKSLLPQVLPNLLPCAKALAPIAKALIGVGGSTGGCEYKGSGFLTDSKNPLDIIGDYAEEGDEEERFQFKEVRSTKRPRGLFEKEEEKSYEKPKEVITKSSLDGRWR